MKKLLCATMAAALTVGSVSAAQAEPGGCVKYGAAGAVGGHVAHHGVLGALGGCVTGMYVRHRYRKEAKEKAALYDKEHPGSKGTWSEKATAYDVEHSTEPGTMTPSAQGSTAPGAQAPATQPQSGSNTQM
ncbi:hypothetical protein [Acetobacter oeni]|uniref:Glycine zipper domain-containing protein n=1 Tax=Acetobacter oeni TaxID=304077 RepID=A0A511XQW3_9PROT|nr:hypothetical protein [Acetobacter oeni]MBB3881657.1 hypothetical protein [Acetobacter oeni]NHO17535.1 hypothetical protein [Acetobacter oeni]GBR08894.1 hypothetical protein AA21952_2725 [Acetobacter oeni LMG 21952]GEN65351.1 hypothetical protein AOE01nite_35750 [Acetobacter oeni]